MQGIATQTDMNCIKMSQVSYKYTHNSLDGNITKDGLDNSFAIFEKIGSLHLLGMFKGKKSCP
jgi:hypothetical protein